MITMDTESLEPIHWLALVLAAITGVIHLILAFEQMPSPIGLPTPLGISFLLAGLGFIAWISLVLLDWRRPLLYLLAIPYVGLQIVMFVALNWPDLITPIAVVDKTVQLVLIAVLIVLYRRES